MFTEVKALLADPRGPVWIGTSGDGLGCYKNGHLTFLRKTDGLPCNPEVKPTLDTADHGQTFLNSSAAQSLV